MRKIRNEASGWPGIFCRTLRFYYVAISPCSPLPHLLHRHRKPVRCSAILARSCPGPVSIIGKVSQTRKFLLTKRQDWWHSTPTTPMYYTASRMLNHHSHLTNPIRSKKLKLSTRVWLVLPDSITSQRGSLIIALSLLQILGAPVEFECSHPVWALLPEKVMKSTLWVRV